MHHFAALHGLINSALDSHGTGAQTTTKYHTLPSDYKVSLHHPENQTWIWSSLDPPAKVWIRGERGTYMHSGIPHGDAAKSSPRKTLPDKRHGFFKNYVSRGKKGWRQKSYVKGNFKKNVFVNQSPYNQSYLTSSSNYIFFKASHYIYGKTDHLNIGQIYDNIKQLLFLRGHHSILVMFFSKNLYLFF